MERVHAYLLTVISNFYFMEKKGKNAITRKLNIVIVEWDAYHGKTPSLSPPPPLPDQKKNYGFSFHQMGRLK